MSGATDVLEQELLELVFMNDDFDNIGDAAGCAGSSTAGTLEISLHTATLNDSSVQTTSEAAYTSYARVTVARSTSGWTFAAGAVDNDNAISFPAATGGSETETDVGIGSAVAATELWLYGALSASLGVSSGITPEIAAGDLDVALT